MDTPVFDVVNMFSQSSISAVPIIDENGKVLNLYETVDVIVRKLFQTLEALTEQVQALVKSGSYYNLDMTMSTALNMRSPDFPGVVTCTSTDSLASLLSLIKARRVHRLVVVEGEVIKFMNFYNIHSFFSSKKRKKVGRGDGCSE